MQMIIEKTFQPFVEKYDTEEEMDYLGWADHMFWFGEVVEISNYYDTRYIPEFWMNGVYDDDPDNYICADVIINPSQPFVIRNTKARESLVIQTFVVPKECVRIDEWDGIMDL